MEINSIICGDALSELKKLPSESINCVVTSPPYFLLRSYLPSNHPNKKKEIGLEPKYKEYIENLINIFKEIKRILKKDGTCFVNLADTYAGGGFGIDSNLENTKQATNRGTMENCFTIQQLRKNNKQIQSKSLMMIPERFAIRMIEEKWNLRNKLVWCLSGGVYIYAKTQKGEMPIMIRDLYRLKTKSVKLWNGKKWTSILGMSRHKRTGKEIEIVLRSGERVTSTPEHKWPTINGIKKTSDLNIGDIIKTAILPEPKNPLMPNLMPDDIAWFIGMYLAEGSKSKECIQISGHQKETERFAKLQKIVNSYGGTIKKYNNNGNGQTINICSKILNSIIKEYLSGKTAIDKSLSVKCWQRSNNFLDKLLTGYLEGDGHWEEKNNRWRLGFCRNYNLERDLRIICARLGYKIKLSPGNVTYQHGHKDIFRGEIRKTINKHFNNKDSSEIIEIRNGRCRFTYDVSIKEKPNLFAMASGVLTHNCKPNAMPESVLDRWKKAHEYIFFFVKNKHYWFDIDTIRTPCSLVSVERVKYEQRRNALGQNPSSIGDKSIKYGMPKRVIELNENGAVPPDFLEIYTNCPEKKSSSEHYATFPFKLIAPLIRAGCREGGVVLDPFVGVGTTALVAKELKRNYIGIDLSEKYCQEAVKRLKNISNPMF